MQCTLDNEVRKFLLTALNTAEPHQPTLTPSLPRQFPVLPLAQAMIAPTPPPTNNEVSVTAPSVSDRIQQMKRADQMKHPQATGGTRRLVSDKDPLWGGSTRNSRGAETKTNQHQLQQQQHTPTTSYVPKKQVREIRTNQQHYQLHHHHQHHQQQQQHQQQQHSVVNTADTGHRAPRSLSSSRRKPVVSKDQREEIHRKQQTMQTIKWLIDQVNRESEQMQKRQKKEKQLEIQKRKRESMDEAKSRQRTVNRLNSALSRQIDMTKQEVRKRQVIHEKFNTKCVENQLFVDTQIQRRNQKEREANSAALAAEFSSRRAKQRKLDAHHSRQRSPPQASAQQQQQKTSWQSTKKRDAYHNVNHPNHGLSHPKMAQLYNQRDKQKRQQQEQQRVPPIHDNYHSRLHSTPTKPGRKRGTTSSSSLSSALGMKQDLVIPADFSNPPPPAKKKKKMIQTTIQQNQQQQQQSSSPRLYCICKTPYDETKFYVGCDLCTNWFHSQCVGITKQMAKKMDTWMCPDCSTTQPKEELYCLCQTPYDDAKFYIGCDACQDWFHGTCVNIRPDEAEHITSYTCPRCIKQQKSATDEQDLDDRDYSNLNKIIRALINHDLSWPFREPVRETEAPGYYKDITSPMDLETVTKRLKGRYYLKLSDLVNDVSLIFDNCRQYNGTDAPMVRCAEIVETTFVSKIRDLRGRR